METVQDASTATHRGRELTGALWFGLLAGPLAVLINEAIEYVLVSWSCGGLDPVTSVLLHAVPLALIILTLVAAFVAWQHRTRPLDSVHDATVEGHSRPGFMALVGVGLSLLSAMAIFAQWMPLWYMNSCTHL